MLTTTQYHDRRAVSETMKAAVQIVALRQGFLGGLSSAWTGSGTIVHPSGIVLTNCHVANPRAMGMPSPPADRLGIAITERSDEAPALSYFAEVIAQSPELDLAVLRIVSDIKGRRADDLTLPTAELGDSDQLELGDRLAIFGFPGIGGETVTFTAGSVSGFSRQRNVSSRRAWIKTDATIAGGNSGGTAVNQWGRLVGIPTQAAASSDVKPVDARPVVDTNRDGRIDERDTPMAIGGFINGLRPINLARPLLEEAGVYLDGGSGGRSSAPPRRPSRPAALPERPARSAEASPFSNLVFSTRLTRDGRPINPTTQTPAGIRALYATFEFSGLRDGMAWSMTWARDGRILVEENLSWNDGPQGRKVVEVSDSPALDDGAYHLVLSLDRAVVLEGKVIVGRSVDESDSQLSGQVVDHFSSRPIADALVIVLRPGVTVRDFVREQSKEMAVTWSRTDREGRFTFPEQLPKGQAYGLVTIARGYTDLTVEAALRIGTSAPERADLGKIEMQPEV